MSDSKKKKELGDMIFNAKMKPLSENRDKEEDPKNESSEHKKTQILLLIGFIVLSTILYFK